MTEPPLFQQQREIWRAFRQAVAERRLTERNATQRWQTEQREADRTLERVLNEAKKRRDQEESKTTQKYQKALQDAGNEQDRIQLQAKQALQQIEDEIQTGYRSELRQANLALERAKKEAQERRTRQESEAQERYDAEVKAAEEAWDKARRLAEEKKGQAEKSWGQCQSRLGEAELPLHQWIPAEIPSVSADEVLGDADPPQALEQSLETVERASMAVHNAVDDLLRWRETWRRRREWAIGLAIVTSFVVLIGMSIRSAQIQEMNRQATATAFHPTYVAMATSTAQAEATAAAEAQATATAQAQATATAQARATATAQAQATATVQAILAARPSSKVVTVYANKDWQETGMFVLEGESIRIKYLSGKWSWACCDPSSYVDASGIAQAINYSDNVIMNCAHAALIAQIANSRLCIRDYFYQKMSLSGWLELRINDRVIGDNSSNGINVIIEVGK